VIKGNSIFLTAVEHSDLEQLKEWRNNPDFRKNFREYREINNENQKIWYDKTVINDRNTMMFSIRDILNNELLGCCGLCYINWVHRYADLSFYIGKANSYVDEQYAPDAVKVLMEYGFNEIGLNKIWTEIYEFDNRKINFLQKFGFKKDGQLRENYFYNGKWWDSMIFSLLSREYRTFTKGTDKI
jgi:RimJ/RimL family protein N-acetyltransferase